MFNENIKYSKTDLKAMLDSYNKDQSKKKGLFSLLIKSNDLTDQYVK